MDNRQMRTMTAFDNVMLYLEQHPIKPEPPLLSGMRRKLEASIRRIRSLEADQHQAKLATTGSVEDRRRKLRRERMMPVVRIAKPLLAYAPGVQAALRVPHARADASTVVDSALRMVEVLSKHAKLVKSAGFPKQFLAEFRQEAQDLRFVARNSDKARQRRTVATAAMTVEFKKAMQALQVIEGLVMLHTNSHSSAFKLWRSRRRVSARIGRPKRRRALTLRPGSEA